MRYLGVAFGVAAAVACGRGDPQQALAATTREAAPARLTAELAWATYWGPPGGGALRTTRFDGAGNVYIAGGTAVAPRWPASAPPLGPLGGDSDVIVAKFDAAGRSLWSLVIGGGGEDYAYVSALDRDGNLIVGGRAGPGFPVTANAFDTSFNGGIGRGPHEPTDGFLLCLSPSGELRWATYLGSAGDDVIRGIEILPDGGIAVSGGNTDRGDLPTTPGVVKPALGGAKDAYVAVLGADGASARFVTYFGPSDDLAMKGDETLRSIALDPAGNLWLGGTTKGTDLRATPDAIQPKQVGSGAYIAKLSPDGRQLPYFSWLGGSERDYVETEGHSDASGAFLVAGATDSSDFPTTPGASSTGAQNDGWVARIAPDGRLAMAARFGGGGNEDLYGPALDRDGFLWAAGSTTSSDLPVTRGARQASFSGGASDALIAAFDSAGAIAFATYWGGEGADIARFVAVDPSRRRVAVAIETTSVDLPLRGAVQKTPGSIYVAVFDTESLADGSPDAPPPKE